MVSLLGNHGIIKNDYFKADVIHAVQQSDGIRHYITSHKEEIPNRSKIYCSLNQERRLINARYHTAGHLLGNIVEILNPNLKAFKGHSFPGEAYVEFAQTSSITLFQGDDEVLNLTTLQNAIDKTIVRNDKTMVFDIAPEAFKAQFYKLPYSVPENKKFRAMRNSNMLPVPSCGGTHLSYIGEIGNMKISKIKNKSNYMRISYEVI